MIELSSLGVHVPQLFDLLSPGDGVGLLPMLVAFFLGIVCARFIISPPPSASPPSPGPTDKVEEDGNGEVDAVEPWRKGNSLIEEGSVEVGGAQREETGVVGERSSQDTGDQSSGNGENGKAWSPLRVITPGSSQRYSLTHEMVGALGSPKAGGSKRTLVDTPRGSFLSLNEESQGSVMKSFKITPEEAGEILDMKIMDNLSPAENAINMLQELLNKPSLTNEERVSVIYAIQVLQVDPDGAGVPFALQTEYEDDMGDEVNDWLLQDFSGLSSRSEKKSRSHMSMKSLARGVLFALRVQRSLERSRPAHPEDSYQSRVPFDCTKDEADAIFQALEGISEWGWDVRPLVQATKGRPLQALGYHILKRDGTNFVEQFSLDEATLRRWLELVETSYNDAKYHNSAHAADVLQSVFAIIVMDAHRFLSDIEQMALVMAAMVHDMGHDGMSNVFHKNALTQRALDHNDQSIQENFHAATLFTRMAADESVNIFKHLSKQHFGQIRQILIHCLLHTDMSKHFVNLKELKGMIESKGQEPDEWVDSSDTLMAAVLHTADIGAQAKPTVVARHWC